MLLWFLQALQSDAQKSAQPYIDTAKSKADEAQKKADEIGKEAQKKAQPIFDSAKDQYKEVEKQAIAAKDKAVKDAQPAIDDAKDKAQKVFKFFGELSRMNFHVWRFLGISNLILNLFKKQFLWGPHSRKIQFKNPIQEIKRYFQGYPTCYKAWTFAYDLVWAQVWIFAQYQTILPWYKYRTAHSVQKV